MQPVVYRAALIAFLLVLLLPSAARADEIVVLRGADDSVAVETAEREDELGFDAERRFTRAITGFAADLDAGQVAELRRDPEVAAVVPDRPVRATAFVPAAPGATVPPGIRRVLAAPTGEVREAATGAVAVVDTGIDLEHPDLNVVPGTDCTGSGTPDDRHGHGTHVAGTIGARNDATGVVGVAPGTAVVPVKVLDDQGNGRTSTVLCGIDWILKNHAARKITVANFSLGGEGVPTSCSATRDPEHPAYCALAAAKVTPVVAAGNAGKDFAGEESEVPAAYPQVLTVAAMADFDGRPGGLARSGCGTDDGHASFSNYATTPEAEAHLVAAPGVCIRSTVIGGGTGSMSGTSMASPHVAALVALCHGEGGFVGPCAGLATPQVIARMRATQTSDHGFTSAAGRLFGPLAMLSDPFAPTPGVAGGEDLATEPAPIAATAPVERPVVAQPVATDPVRSDPPRLHAPVVTVGAITLARLRGRGVPVRVACQASCAGNLRLRVSAAVARRLGLRGTTIALARVTRAGTVRLRPSAAVRRRVARLRGVRATVTGDVRSAVGDAHLARRVRLR